VDDLPGPTLADSACASQHLQNRGDQTRVSARQGTRVRPAALW